MVPVQENDILGNDMSKLIVSRVLREILCMRFYVPHILQPIDSSRGAFQAGKEGARIAMLGRSLVLATRA